MRAGVRVGVDVGTVRVGVARSDPSGILATPVETVRRDPARRSDLDRIVEIVAECEAIEIVVGLPTGLSGREGDAAAGARKYAVDIARRVAPVSVRVVDERLTTVTAHRYAEQNHRDQQDHPGAAPTSFSSLLGAPTGLPPGPGPGRPPDDVVERPLVHSGHASGSC